MWRRIGLRGEGGGGKGEGGEGRLGRGLGLRAEAERKELWSGRRAVRLFRSFLEVTLRWSATQHGTRRTGSSRRYYVQNWRADVVAMAKSDGTPLEYVFYSPYGEPIVHPLADSHLAGQVRCLAQCLTLAGFYEERSRDGIRVQ